MLAAGNTLIFDADGLIKLNRAGILLTVAQAYRCIVPSEVYYEAVTAGLAMHHPDAMDIDAIISSEMEIWPEPLVTSESMFGAGETAALNLFYQMGDRMANIISDDRNFRVHLTGIGCPSIVPSDVIVRMAQLKLITKERALDALDKLRPHIRVSRFIASVDGVEAVNDYSTEA